MRRQARVRAVGSKPRKRNAWVPKGSTTQKAAPPMPTSDEGKDGPGGVEDDGTYDKDGPATWEALLGPRVETGATETR